MREFRPTRRFPEACSDDLVAILFALVFGTMTFLSTLGWAALGASIGRRLVSRRAIRAFNIAMALLLVASLIPVIVG